MIVYIYKLLKKGGFRRTALTDLCFLEAGGGEVRKTLSFEPFYTKMISLPRQARDKHGESTQKRDDALFAGAASGSGRCGRQVGKRHFLRQLCIKCIILSRQARDKHRENTKKSGVSHRLRLLDAAGGKVIGKSEIAHSEKIGAVACGGTLCNTR